MAISAKYRYDGAYLELRAGIQALTPEVFAGTPFEAPYRRNAPNPENFPVLVEELETFVANEYAWPEEDLRSLAAPTLLVIANADIVRPEHAVELFHLLGGGVLSDVTGRLPSSRLAILPGTRTARSCPDAPTCCWRQSRPFSMRRCPKHREPAGAMTTERPGG